MKTSEQVIPATEAIKQIEAIETADELNAFVGEKEERKSVLAASDKRYAELTEGSEPDEAEDVDEAPTPAVDESDDNPAETEEETEAFELSGEKYKALKEAVTNKIAEEKSRFTNGVLPKGEAKDIEELSKKVFATAAEEVEDTVEVPELEFGQLLMKLEIQLVTDKGRRGLSTPAKINKALIDAFEALIETEEE